jgi:hypothetical protein
MQDEHMRTTKGQVGRKHAECRIMWSDFVGVANRPAWHAHSAARRLIPRVWRVDPLGCPGCQNPMRVIAAIDDPRVVEKTLRHLALWRDPRPRPPRACQGSRLSAEKGVSRAVPAIGNEPSRATLPVVSAVLARAQDIALFLAFLA